MQVIDIEKLAKLSFIELNESDRISILSDFQMLLTSVEQLKELKIDDRYLTNIHNNSLREDRVFPSTIRTDILRNAPVTENGYVIVPNVME